MIVFYCVLVLLIIILIIFTSKVYVKINNFEVRNIESLNNIIKSIYQKKYENVFDYTNFAVSITLKIFYIIPVFFIKIDNIKVKEILKKQMIKNLKMKNEKPKKYKEKIKRQNIFISKTKSKFYKILKINRLEIILALGVVEADITAMLVGIFNILISFFFSCYCMLDTYDKYYKQSSALQEKQFGQLMKKMKYSVKPVYRDDLHFELNMKVKVVLSLFQFIV